MLCMLFVLIFIVFMYYFIGISFAIRPSGRKSAIKLIDWLIGWPILPSFINFFCVIIVADIVYLDYYFVDIIHTFHW